jgi:hypothetical protein
VGGLTLLGCLQAVIIVTQVILSAKAKTDKAIVFLPHTLNQSLALLTMTAVQIENEKHCSKREWLAP